MKHNTELEAARMRFKYIEMEFELLKKQRLERK